MDQTGHEKNEYDVAKAVTITPELVEFLGSTLKVLGGSRLTIEEFLRTHRRGVSVTEKIRELTPMEEECVLLDASCISALLDTMKRLGGRKESELTGKDFPVLTLCKMIGTFFGRLSAFICVKEEGLLTDAGKFSLDAGDTILFNTYDNRLWLCKGKIAGDDPLMFVLRRMGEKASSEFDLRKWHPRKKMN